MTNTGTRRGDEVLRALAATCGGFVREGDVVGRLGGEEFCVLLPEADAKTALEAAERLRTAVESMRIEAAGRLLRITASFGVALRREGESDAACAVSRADETLY